MSMFTLSQEEETLHLYAALVQKDLEAYHACVSRDETDFIWKHIFEDHLVCLYSSGSLFSLSIFQTRSMNYFKEAEMRSRTPPRIHPLLLSLSEAWKVSDISPDIRSISENDLRVIGNPYYVSPAEFPPLNGYFGKQPMGMLAAVHI